MKRPNIAALLALTLMAGVVATLFTASTRSVTFAQDDAPAAVLHPIVGSWLLRVDARDPASPPVLVVYHADGTYTDSAVGRTGGVGVWEPIDDTSVSATIVFHAEDETGNLTTTRIRSVATVDESGNAYTSDYTREVIGADGESSGEMGPGTATGERLMVEERGDPVGPMSGTVATPTS